ncbi:MAG TPA: hypothetical protein VLH56_10180 [Dissulfurispiraceae bacterium]|nr:hypothetical protein [Dissulfurispiraceae bacterium]
MGKEEVSSLRLTATDDTKAAMQSITQNINKITESVKAMETGMKGSLAGIKAKWLEISAAIYVAQAMFKKGWEMALDAAKFQENMELLNGLTSIYGKTADEVLAKWQELSKGMIGKADLVEIGLSTMGKNVSLDTMNELIEHGKTLSILMRTSIPEAVAKTADAIASGKEKTLKMAAGVLDLKARFGESMESWSETRKQAEMLAVVMEKVKEAEERMAESGTSSADKMEMFLVRIRDKHLEMGFIALRVYAGMSAAMNALAAGALNLYRYLLEIPKAFAYVMAHAGVTKKVREEGRQWLAELKADQEAANEASINLAGESLKDWEIATAPKEALKLGSSKPFSGFKDRTGDKDARKAALERAEQLAKADREYLKQRLEVAAELAKEEEKAADLRVAQGLMGEQAFQDEKLRIQRDGAAISIAVDEMLIQHYETEWERKKALYGNDAKERVKAEEEKNQAIQKLQNDIEKKTIQLNGIILDGDKQKIESSKRLEQAERDGELKVLEAKIALQKQLIGLRQGRGEITPLQARQSELALDEERIKKRLGNVQESYNKAPVDSPERTSFKAEIDDLTISLDALAEQAERVRQEMDGSFGEGFAEGVARVMANAKTAFQEGRELAQGVADAMTNAFSDFFNSASENFLNFRQLSYKVFSDIANMLSKMLMNKAITGLFGALGFEGLTAHRGGLVMHSGGLVPRFHVGGLSGDERPAVLQTGEFVLQRKAVQSVGADTLGEINKTGKVPGTLAAAQDVTIVNVLDESLLHKALGSRAGKRIIMNYIREAQA